MLVGRVKVEIFADDLMVWFVVLISKALYPESNLIRSEHIPRPKLFLKNGKEYTD